MSELSNSGVLQVRLRPMLSDTCSKKRSKAGFFASAAWVPFPSIEVSRVKQIKQLETSRWRTCADVPCLLFKEGECKDDEIVVEKWLSL